MYKKLCLEDFSKKELKMVRSISEHWYDLIQNKKFCVDEVSPTRIFDMVAMDCFLDNKQGKAVDSLRRCLYNLKNCKIYRNTKEWDDLIQL